MNLEKVKQELLARKANEKRLLVDKWNNLKQFVTVDSIPDLPILKDKEEYDRVVVTNLIRCGAIPKEQLEVGATYEGNCRNATEAVWNGKQFEYKRYKFGTWFDDKINHFQDDNGYDLFVPIKKKI